VAASARDGLRRYAAPLLLGLLLAAAAAVLLVYSSGLAPFQDSWEFLMHRRAFTVDALLEPHNEHIVLVPVLIEQLLLRLFGIGSTLPEFVVLTALLLATAALLFVYVRRRLGPWPALIAAALALFLGPAWQDLLWPFQIGFVGSALFGLAMLLALEREDRRGNVAACAFLALAIGFSSLGLSFAVAAAVDVLQRRRALGWRRAYVVLAPLALYALWYLGWGHEAENHLSLHNVLVSPRYLVEGAAAAVGSLLALATIFDEAVGRSHWGYVVLALLVALAVYGLVRRREVPSRLWPVLAAAVSFWLLAGFNAIPGREAWSSRYLYVGALFVLLIAADLLKGVRFSRWALVAGAVATLVVVGFNLVPLREGRDFFRAQTVLTRADLGAIEIAGGSVEPTFTLSPEVAGTSFLSEIEAGEYLSAVDEYGSPAYSPSELAAAPEVGRKQADIVLANALPVSIEVDTDSGSVPGGRCVEVPAGAGPGAPPLRLRPGVTTVELGPGAPGTIRLRRFAVATYPLVSEGIGAGSMTKLSIPQDASARPWRLQVEAAQGATVCR
jgi:MFS family permease